MAAVCGATFLLCPPALADLNKFEAEAGNVHGKSIHTMPRRIMEVELFIDTVLPDLYCY